MTKVCQKCSEEKSIEGFYKARGGNTTPKTTSFNVYDELQDLSVEELKAMADARRLPYAVALANITGDLNTGSIIRSACVLGAERVFVFGKKKYDRRSTVGAHNYIDIISYPDDADLFDWSVVFQTIRVEGYTPVIIEQGGAPLYAQDVGHIPPPICLVFGSESEGIPPEHWSNELCYEIPQPGIVRSLNVAAAASIAMWHVMRGFLPSQSPEC